MNRVRSLLYVPADNQRMMDKSVGCDADAIIYDLEDAVAASNKELAREMLERFAPKALSAGKEILVRINNVDTDYFGKDVEAVVASGIETVVLPKADSFVVTYASNVMTECEKKYAAAKTSIIPLIETPSGVVNMYALLKESDRVVAAQLGAEDLTKELQIGRTKTGAEIEYTRNKFVMVCGALRIGAVDTPYTDIKDIDGLHAECAKVKGMGMTAKTCIHPAHIEAINSTFCPTEEEVRAALKIVEAAEAEENKGKGAFAVDGKMIDAPIVGRAEKIVERAGIFNML